MSIRSTNIHDLNTLHTQGRAFAFYLKHIAKQINACETSQDFSPIKSAFGKEYQIVTELHNTISNKLKFNECHD